MKIQMDSKNYIELNLINDKKLDLVLIFPGGGYEHTSSRESVPISNIF